MLLKNLIKNIPSNKNNIPIAGIASNSNDVRKNYIFLKKILNPSPTMFIKNIAFNIAQQYQ